MAASTGGGTARTAEMIRCRGTKLASSRRAPRGTEAQNPVGRDVVVAMPGVVTPPLSAGPRSAGVRRDLELPEPELPQPAAEGQRGGRPVLGVPPALGQVPAVAAE